MGGKSIIDQYSIDKTINTSNKNINTKQIIHSLSYNRVDFRKLSLKRNCMITYY